MNNSNIKFDAIFSTQHGKNGMPMQTVEEYKEMHSHTDPNVSWSLASGTNWSNLALILGIDINDFGKKGRRSIDRTAETIPGRVPRVQKRVQPVPVQPVQPVPFQPVQSIPFQPVPVQPVINNMTMTIEAFKRAFELLNPTVNNPLNESRILELIQSELEKFQPPVPVLNVNSPKGTNQIQGLVHHLFEDILMLASCRIHTYLVGPAGSGKTHTCEQIADALGLESYCLSVCVQSTKSDLLGYQSITTGEYIRTSFREAYEKGGVFILDEIDNGNANVLSVLNSSLSNGSCMFPDGKIKKHEDFVLLACGNTYGSGADSIFVGRNALDGATTDRFAQVHFPYDETIENKISIDQKYTSFVQEVRKELKDERVIISPRASINGGKLLSTGMSIEKVVQYTILKGLPQTMKDRVVVIQRKHFK